MTPDLLSLQLVYPCPKKNYFLQFNSLTKEGIVPDFDFDSAKALDDHECEVFKNQTAILVIELGAPTLLRTQQNVRTTFADQIANLGSLELPYFSFLLQIVKA